MNIEGACTIEGRIQRQDRSLEDQALVAEAIETLCLHWSETLTAVEMQGELGAPDWAAFELRTWRLGESLRPFVRKKRWRGKGPLLDAVARILLDARLGKGRQTFALLLGESGGQEYAEALGRALEDKEVRGHAIKALTKAKIGGFAGEIAGVQAQESGWIRSAAKKYLQNLSS